MEVTINNRTVQAPDNCFLYEALMQVGVRHTRGIAVAVNNQVIPGAQWTAYKLNHADKVTLIKASQGG